MNSLTKSYSLILDKYSLLKKKAVLRWILMLPAAGCEYYKRTGGCTMCGFHTATRKYSHGFLWPSFAFKGLFKLAERSVHQLMPNELFIFNGGSFLNEKELPIGFQNYVFNFVGQSKNIDHLFIESRCEYIKESRLDKIAQQLRGKRLSVGIGFESQDDYVRNTLIKKGLSKSHFEKTVKSLKDHGFDVKAYVFLKPLGLSEKQAFTETINTIKYVLSVGVTEIDLSCAFVQEKTKMFDEFKSGIFQPPYLWTVLEIIKEVIKNNWPVSIGGFTDEPPPIAIPANCDECSPAIYRAIENFRSTRVLLDVPNCSCREKWLKEMDF